MARIMVIDDNMETRMAVRRILERAGHQVIEATNGEEGARLFSQNPPDLLITDIAMPGKDGVETLLELRTDFPDIKVIVMSGRSRALLPAAEELGAVHTLSKPFTRSELLKMLEEVLEDDG